MQQEKVLIALIPNATEENITRTDVKAMDAFLRAAKDKGFTVIGALCAKQPAIFEPADFGGRVALNRDGSYSSASLEPADLIATVNDQGNFLLSQYLSQHFSRQKIVVMKVTGIESAGLDAMYRQLSEQAIPMEVLNPRDTHSQYALTVFNPVPRLQN